MSGSVVHILNTFGNNVVSLVKTEYALKETRFVVHTRRGAGKSLARPGRKQAKVTKLGIYSTYSPRSSINFLARCSNFASHKKKFRNLSVQPGLRGRNDLRVGRKKGEPLFFSVQGKGASPTGPDPENRVGDQDNGRPGRPVSSGLPVPGEPGHCRARTRPPWCPSRGVFSFKMTFSCTSRDE